MSSSAPSSGPLDVTLAAVDRDLVDIVGESSHPRSPFLARFARVWSKSASRRPCSLALESESNCDSSTDTLSLLRSRLRAVALLTTIGFVSFLVFHLVAVVSLADDGLLKKGAEFDLLPTHVVVTLVVATIYAYLALGRCVSKTKLQAAEWIVFGAPAAFTLQWQYLNITAMSERFDFLPPLNPLWLVLIFTYALFIPRTWKHAAVVLCSIAAAPLVLVAFLLATDPLVRGAQNANVLYFVEQTLELGIAVATGVVGVAAIHKLRREVFEARRLGQYRLGALIGQGGMGEVYLAEHQMMKRPCAIKVIRPEKTGDPTNLARFEREVRLTARLSHWNTIDIFDYGRADDGTFYYVMEYLPGLSLKQLVQRFGPICPGRTIYLLRQTCEALAEAHGAGLIHRDIKPANIFAAHRGGVYDVAKLLDFGLARPIASTLDRELTNSGSITGSPLFMSPEQALGEEPDERSDIYSLGAVAYHLLSGRPPFEHESPVRLIASHMHETPTALHDLLPNVPTDLERVVMTCLQKRREDRYQTAEELLAALNECESANSWGREQAAAWWNEMERSASPASCTTEAAPAEETSVVSLPA
ncbi:MAG TPA: serine/threonine-protein kinase [Pirellulaceae bacterium]|jgi:serine/threonine-protein kinase|nr:serine/threonine-protein kinase [Pirellulaceae bacterium]